MVNADQAASLARVMKVIAQPLALRLLGWITEGPATLEQLTERLGVETGDLGGHLGALVAAGVVKVDPTTTSPTFTLDETVLTGLGATAEALLASTARGAASQQNRSSEGPELNEEEKVLRDFFAGPCLKQIPARRKKLLIVLRHLLGRFEPGREYPEKEVNAILRSAHEDVATLRRDLVDFGFMVRANGIYRVTPTTGAGTTEDPPDD